MFNKQNTYEQQVLTEYIHTHVDIKRHIGEDLGLHQWWKENCWERTRPFSDSFNGERRTETENGTGFRFGTNLVQALISRKKESNKQESRCFGPGPLKLQVGPWLYSPFIAQHFHGPLSATDKITTTTASFFSLFFFFFNHFEVVSMASLSFNTTTSRLRTTPLVQPQNHNNNKPISNFKIASLFSSKNWPKLRLIRPNSISESSVEQQLELEQEAEEEEDDPTAELCYFDPETDPNVVSEWEVDFCSRPIIDSRGKKVWELVVCDESLSLQYTKYFPNNVINSVTLKEALQGISDDLAIPLPEKIRFFRSNFGFKSSLFQYFFHVCWFIVSDDDMKFR